MFLYKWNVLDSKWRPEIIKGKIKYENLFSTTGIRKNGNYSETRITKYANKKTISKRNYHCYSQSFLEYHFSMRLPECMFLWLRRRKFFLLFCCYESCFFLHDHPLSQLESHGCDDTSFLQGLEDNDLEDTGVKSRGHRNAILAAIRISPEPDIEPWVPVNIFRTFVVHYCCYLF